MSKEKIILFCSSGKTYGHFLKTHALYLAVREQFTCFEAINPTKFTALFRNDGQIVEDELNFANDSYSQYDGLVENVGRLVLFLEKHKPDLVVGDKLPNLMTACFKLGIPYFSISHSSQMTHNWQNKENPNLALFDRYWKEFLLRKPVQDDSWFFYRNWGDYIVFADDQISQEDKLKRFGYKYKCIGHISLSLGDNQNHLGIIHELINKNQANMVVLVTFSSYASQQTDDLVVGLAMTHPNILFVYPREELNYLDTLVIKNSVSNLYYPVFIDYEIVKPITSLVICLPGSGTLNSLRDFNREILSFYVHSEQEDNAFNYKHDKFSYHEFGKSTFELCVSSIKRAPLISDLADEVKSSERTDSLEKFRRLLLDFILKKR